MDEPTPDPESHQDEPTRTSSRAGPSRDPHLLLEELERVRKDVTTTVDYFQGDGPVRVLLLGPVDDRHAAFS